MIPHYQLQCHTCQPIQFTCIKYNFFIILGGIWPHWKINTGKHNFHEILLLCKTEQKVGKTVERAANTRHRQMHTDWPSAVG